MYRTDVSSTPSVIVFATGSARVNVRLTSSIRSVDGTQLLLVRDMARATRWRTCIGG